MSRHNFIKTLPIISLVIALIIYVLMGVSGYTAATALTSSLMGLSGSTEDDSFINVIENPDDSMTFEFNLPANNPGVIGITAVLNSTLVSDQGNVIANGIKSQSVPPGYITYLTLTMSVSPEVAETFESHPLTLIIEIKCQTLFQLVEISVCVEIMEDHSS